MTYIANLLHNIAMSKNNLLESINHYTETKSFSLHHTLVGGDNPNALYLHYHPEMEFLYLFRGTLHFTVEDKSFTLLPGDAVFVPPYLVHNAVKDEGTECEYSAVVFSAEWLFGREDISAKEYLKALDCNRYDCVCHLSCKDTDNAAALALLRKFSAYRGQPVQSYELLLRGQLLICFQRLYDTCFSKFHLSEEKASLQAGLEKTLAHMNDCFMQKTTLQELAAYSGYSIGHFEHMFREYTGSSPFEYLNRIRIVNASGLLVSSDKKIIEIAADCGFDNISYFNRTFKKILGISPKEYRKKNSL